MLKFSLADCHAVVCVSHTSKENTVLRACVPPHRVAVIPNGLPSDLNPVDLARSLKNNAPTPGAKTPVPLVGPTARYTLPMYSLVHTMCSGLQNIQYILGHTATPLLHSPREGR